jgi:DNA-binding response OmpR family regulator
MRVLLVEDNQADVFLVKDAIQRAGIDADIQTVDDGEKAISLIAEIDRNSAATAHDCFLIDLNLPKCGGAEVLESVRSSVKSADAVVIMITSSRASSDRELVLRLGATDVFVKPFQLQEFRNLAKLVQSLHEQHCRRSSSGLI